MSPFQFVLAVLCAWRQRELEDVITFLREENRVLKVRLEDVGCVSRTTSVGASRNSAIAWAAGCCAESRRS